MGFLQRELEQKRGMLETDIIVLSYTHGKIIPRKQKTLRTGRGGLASKRNWIPYRLGDSTSPAGVTCLSPRLKA